MVRELREDRSEGMVVPETRAVKAESSGKAERTAVTSREDTDKMGVVDGSARRMKWERKRRLGAIRGIIIARPPSGGDDRVAPELERWWASESENEAESEPLQREGDGEDAEGWMDEMMTDEMDGHDLLWGYFLH
ncbi:hypothetical protein SAY86_018131 [Trapa natans]|uniref:Uncharacterized protein n=1 Tax=Trapa natans TaxID=22666 RepID=A0AAN7L9K6_TRANT|nr:hypothetical protein SAY86_018131 [Trapa natans]